MTRSLPSEEDSRCGFAEILRDRTKMVHREAERSGFIADLLRGRATRAGYVRFLRNLVPVYATMETALESRPRSDLIVPFAAPALRRLAALIADLTVIAGPEWSESCPLLPQASAYAEAIAAVATDDPRLVAHAYARYLGDLSGGQILKPLLARSLGLRPDALGFYVFPDLPDLDAPKAAMRRALDGVPVGSPEAAAIAAEAVSAFRHNIAVSEAVSVAPG